MEGKIFPGSNNPDQDRAKILFDYYYQAAERIVNEEERVEDEIKKLETERNKLKRALQNNNILKWLLAVLIIPFIYFLIKGNQLVKQLNELNEKIAEQEKKHKDIFRNYRVRKLGMAYIPIAGQIKYDDKSFIVDYAGITEEFEFKVQAIKENDLLIEKIALLEKLLTEAPIIEGAKTSRKTDTAQYDTSVIHINQHEYTGTLEKTLNSISSCLQNTGTQSVRLPLVKKNSDYMKFLQEFATATPPENAFKTEVFNVKQYDAEISKFRELNDLKNSLPGRSGKFEEAFDELTTRLKQAVQLISDLKINSTNKLTQQSNKLFFKILKAPYNHYSSLAEAPAIERIRKEQFQFRSDNEKYIPFQLKESSQVKYDLIANTWVASAGNNTDFPIAIHQIQEEIISPIIRNLLNETENERREVYNRITEHKNNYLNQWKRESEALYEQNRQESGELMQQLQTNLDEYIAAFNTLISLKKAEESMLQATGSEISESEVAQLTEMFEKQIREFHQIRSDFEVFMGSIKEDIQKQAGLFECLSRTEAKLRDGIFQEIIKAHDNPDQLDDRKKPFLAVNPFFAKECELPPLPGNKNSITEDSLSDPKQEKMPSLIDKQTLPEINQEEKSL